MTLITRAFHCNKPHEEEQTVLIYGTTNGLRERRIKYYTIDNITPHIIIAVQKSGHMEINVACCVYGCGVKWKNEDNISAGVQYLNLRRYEMSNKDWNSLLFFKNTNYEIF